MKKPDLIDTIYKVIEVADRYDLQKKQLAAITGLHRTTLTRAFNHPLDAGLTLSSWQKIINAIWLCVGKKDA